MFLMERIIGMVAPHRCLVCGVEGVVVCAWCLPELAPPLPDRCYQCRAQTDNSQVCRRCRPGGAIGHLWVRTPYAGLARRLVYDFKFERKRDAATTLARLTAEKLPHLPRGTLVTHVPTVRSRIRMRGYDHAELLARDLAEELGLDYERLLIRVGHARQVGAGRAARLTQLRGAFRVARPVPDRPILLVDDLVTTGGTLQAAAACLKQNSAPVVDAVVFAQKE